MEVSVKLKDMDVFKKLVNIIKDITEDSRVPIEVKSEVKEKINKIIDDGKEKS